MGGESLQNLSVWHICVPTVHWGQWLWVACPMVKAWKGLLPVLEGGALLCTPLDTKLLDFPRTRGDHMVEQTHHQRWARREKSLPALIKPKGLVNSVNFDCKHSKDREKGAVVSVRKVIPES